MVTWTLLLKILVATNVQRGSEEDRFIFITIYNQKKKFFESFFPLLFRTGAHQCSAYVRLVSNYVCFLIKLERRSGWGQAAFGLGKGLRAWEHQYFLPISKLFVNRRAGMADFNQRKRLDNSHWQSKV